MVSVLTCEVVRVLILPTDEDKKPLRVQMRLNEAADDPQLHQLVSFFINPFNTLQLYTCYNDGIVALWDYEDGVMLKV